MYGLWEGTVVTFMLNFSYQVLSLLNSLPLSWNNVLVAQNMPNQFLINACNIDNIFLIITALLCLVNPLFIREL